MQLEEDKSQGQFVIKAYDDNSITVNDETYTKSLIIGLNHLNSEWQPQNMSELTVSDLQPIFDLQPQLVILGTGVNFVLPSKEIMAAFHSRNIGFEFMNTAAACRTFVVLSAEGRNLVTALLLNTSDQ